MSEFNDSNFAKLNCIQQEIADIFERNNLTRSEVFAVLKGMRCFKMIDRAFSENVWEQMIETGDYFNITDDLGPNHHIAYKLKRVEHLKSHTDQQLAQLQSKLDCAVKALEDLLDKNELLLSELKSIKSRLVRIHNNDDEKITANNLRAECLVIASLVGYEIEAVNPLNISPSIKRARLALEEIKK